MPFEPFRPQRKDLCAPPDSGRPRDESAKTSLVQSIVIDYLGWSESVRYHSETLGSARWASSSRRLP